MRCLSVFIQLFHVLLLLAGQRNCCGAFNISDVSRSLSDSLSQSVESEGEDVSSATSTIEEGLASSTLSPMEYFVLSQSKSISSEVVQPSKTISHPRKDSTTTTTTTSSDFTTMPTTTTYKGGFVDETTLPPPSPEPSVEQFSSYTIVEPLTALLQNPMASLGVAVVGIVASFVPAVVDSPVFASYSVRLNSLERSIACHPHVNETASMLELPVPVKLDGSHFSGPLIGSTVLFILVPSALVEGVRRRPQRFLESRKRQRIISCIRAVLLAYFFPPAVGTSFLILFRGDGTAPRLVAAACLGIAFVAVYPIVEVLRQPITSQFLVVYVDETEIIRGGSEEAEPDVASENPISLREGKSTAAEEPRETPKPIIEPAETPKPAGEEQKNMVTFSFDAEAVSAMFAPLPAAHRNRKRKGKKKKHKKRGMTAEKANVDETPRGEGEEVIEDYATAIPVKNPLVALMNQPISEVESLSAHSHSSGSNRSTLLPLLDAAHPEGNQNDAREPRLVDAEVGGDTGGTEGHTQNEEQMSEESKPTNDDDDSGSTATDDTVPDFNATVNTMPELSATARSMPDLLATFDSIPELSATFADLSKTRSSYRLKMAAAAAAVQKDRNARKKEAAVIIRHRKYMDYRNVKEDSLFEETYSCFVDACRDPVKALHRVYFLEELSLSTALCFADSFRPANCTSIAVFKALLCCVHLWYVWHHAPYAKKRSHRLSILAAALLCIISVVAMYQTLAETETEAATSETMFALLTLLFVLQFVVIFLIVVRRTKRRVFLSRLFRKILSVPYETHDSVEKNLCDDGQWRTPEEQTDTLSRPLLSETAVEFDAATSQLELQAKLQAALQPVIPINPLGHTIFEARQQNSPDEGKLVEALRKALESFVVYGVQEPFPLRSLELALQVALAPFVPSGHVDSSLEMSPSVEAALDIALASLMPPQRNFRKPKQEAHEEDDETQQQQQQQGASIIEMSAFEERKPQRREFSPQSWLAQHIRQLKNKKQHKNMWLEKELAQLAASEHHVVEEPFSFDRPWVNSAKVDPQKEARNAARTSRIVAAAHQRIAESRRLVEQRNRMPVGFSTYGVAVSGSP